MRKFKQRISLEQKVFADPMPSGFLLIRMSETVAKRDTKEWTEAGTVHPDAVSKVFNLIKRLRKYVADYRAEVIRRDKIIRELYTRLERRRLHGPVEPNTQEWEDERTALYRARIISAAK